MFHLNQFYPPKPNHIRRIYLDATKNCPLYMEVKVKYIPKKRKQK